MGVPHGTNFEQPAILPLISMLLQLSGTSYESDSVSLVEKLPTHLVHLRLFLVPGFFYDFRQRD